MRTNEGELEQWQVDANRERFIRERAEKMARFAARSPALDFQKYLDFAQRELTRLTKWEERAVYHNMTYGADGVCPVDWKEFYQTEQDIQQRMIAMGAAEYEQWAKIQTEEDNETAVTRRRRRQKIEWSLQRSKDAVARHSGRTTKQQKEHERSGNYPW